MPVEDPHLLKGITGMILKQVFSMGLPSSETGCPLTVLTSGSL